jgi:hypothetical protein
MQITVVAKLRKRSWILMLAILTESLLADVGISLLFGRLAERLRVFDETGPSRSVVVDQS